MGARRVAVPLQHQGVVIMSIALYQLRLYWDGAQGAARRGAHLLKLTQAPQLPGAEGTRFSAIDYAPEVQLAQLRDDRGRWREMTGGEVAGARALLAAL
jgi:hypothetical protein